MLRVLALLAFVTSILVPTPSSATAGRNTLTRLTQAGLISIASAPGHDAHPGERRTEPASPESSARAGSGGSPPPTPATWNVGEARQLLGPHRLTPVSSVVVVFAASAPAASSHLRTRADARRPRGRNAERQRAGMALWGSRRSS